MNKGWLISIGSLFFVSLIILFQSSRGISEAPYQNGYDEGYNDATDGIENVCAPRRCRAKDPYERGYKLGYRKGVRKKKTEWSKKEKKNKNFIRPLIDSPGKTIGSDFNGDGIHDIIAGAYGNDDCADGNTCGAAYIFFGASNLGGTKDTGNGDEDVKILGNVAQDKLGISVGGARNNPGP